MKTWYATKGSNGQGIIAEEETGRTVAIVYDEKDAVVLAASHDLREALELLYESHRGERNFYQSTTAIKVRAALSKATHP